MTTQAKTFNDLPFCLSYDIDGLEFYYQPIVYKDNPESYVAAYVRMKDELDEPHVFLFEDYLFGVSAPSFEEAALRLVKSFNMKFIQNRIDGCRWSLVSHNDKAICFNMDKYFEPNDE